MAAFIWLLINTAAVSSYRLPHPGTSTSKFNTDRVALNFRSKDVFVCMSIVLSPSCSCSDLKGVSEVFRLLVEFPRRSGREEDTDTTEGFLLHFNTDWKSSTTAGKSSVVGNSSCEIEGQLV